MKFYELEKKIKKAYFTDSDIKLYGFNVYPYQFSLWIKDKKLGRIKRGIYYFEERKLEITAEEVAGLIYGPSYISLESALSRYNFIPEKVFSVTSVTTKRTNKFNNYFGKFIYRKINRKLFWGYNPIETKNGKYLLADPEKALLDYLYLNLNQFNKWEDVEEVRFNYIEIKDKINKDRIKKYSAIFNIKKLDRIVNSILKQC